MKERESGKKIVNRKNIVKEDLFRNMEIEAIKFLMHVMMYYYPNFVSKIIVFNMPWILGTVWNLVKTFLPANGRDMIKFLDKSSIQQFIEISSLNLST